MTQEEIIKQARAEIKRLKEEALKKKKDQETEMLTNKITAAVLERLQPLFSSSEEMVSALKEISTAPEIKKKEILDAISKMKIEPVVNVPPVKVPEIKVPEPKITVKQPEIKVPKPNVVVRPAEVRIPKTEFPKEIKVNGFASFVKALFVLLKDKIKVSLIGIDRDNPLPVILTDENGVFYKAITKIDRLISGGGGLRERRASSVEIENLTLTNANTVYSYDIPDNTLTMDIKLREQGYSLLYSWSNWGEYMTIPAGGSRTFSGIDFVGKTIYLKSPGSAQIAEIECLVEK